MKLGTETKISSLTNDFFVFQKIFSGLAWATIYISSFACISSFDNTVDA